MKQDTTDSRPETWVAERLCVSRRTVQGWRAKGQGPPYVRFPSGVVRYRVRDIEEWIDEHTVFLSGPA